MPIAKSLHFGASTILLLVVLFANMISVVEVKELFFKNYFPLQSVCNNYPDYLGVCFESRQFVYTFMVERSTTGFVILCTILAIPLLLVCCCCCLLAGSGRR